LTLPGLQFTNYILNRKIQPPYVKQNEEKNEHKVLEAKAWTIGFFAQQSE
jgi:hypothetical protein